MTQGALMLVHNNTQCDYARLAAVNTLLIEHHLKIPVAVIMDTSTKQWVCSQPLLRPFLDKWHVIVNDDIWQWPEQQHNYQDTRRGQQTAVWYNQTRINAWQLTPWDRTLLLDADYLQLSDQLSSWLNSSGISAPRGHRLLDPKSDQLDTQRRVHAQGPDMFWATQVCWSSNDPETDILYQVMQHVLENYQFYVQMYQWNDRRIRNDFILTVAAHIINNHQHMGPVRAQPQICVSAGVDDVLELSLDSAVFLVERAKHPNDFLTLRVRQPVHVLNKHAILRLADSFLMEHT